ncbi:hypothetical protein TNCV_3525911 [Trichonephila clavipes]|nr:hypothetical protein TNCV_3525911 [Trichonephila clavipes]
MLSGLLSRNMRTGSSVPLLRYWTTLLFKVPRWLCELGLLNGSLVDQIGHLWAFTALPEGLELASLVTLLLELQFRDGGIRLLYPVTSCRVLSGEHPTTQTDAD